MTQNKLVFELAVIPIVILALSLIVALGADLTKDDIKMFVPIFTFFSIFTPKNSSPNKSKTIVTFALLGLFFSVLTTLLYNSVLPTDIPMLNFFSSIVIFFFFYLIYIHAKLLKFFDKKE